MTCTTETKDTLSVAVETLDVRNPGTTLLSLLRDPKSEIKETELPVADEISLQNVSFGPEPNITVRSAPSRASPLKQPPSRPCWTPPKATI